MQQQIARNKHEKKIKTIINPNLKIISETEMIRPEKSEVNRLLADNSKAKEIGWEPTTSFEQGLTKTTEYIKNNLSLFKTSIYNR